MSATPRILGGRYEVGELVGRGGMADVHAGHDTRLGRPVAIKILRSDLARDPSFLQRFRREAQASAGLNHANIVAVYDSGEDTFVEAAGGTVDIPYIVMEFVDGQTLREILNEEKKVSADEACRIMMGVLSALEYSHSKGIVHRDIKPGNVMVTRGGSVKVMDFGIARALADVGATMTSAQAVVGTARYLSPEQAQGQSVDARTDLYSAGCVLFELLTGRAPFVGEPVSLVYQHIGEQPQPPSLYESSVSPALDAVVLHSLAKGRDDRYQSAADFRADVLAARSGQPISAAAQASTVTSADHTEVVDYPTRRAAATAAAADSTAELDSREPSRSHAGWWALAAVTALAAILGIGYVFMHSPSSPEKVTVASVRGMTYEQAAKTLSPDFTVTKREVADNAAENTVIDQDPAGGTEASRRSDVTLTVSTGPDSVKVPNVVGDAVNEAKAALLAAGIDENHIKISPTKKDDTGLDAGIIAESNPKAGASLGTSSDITLYESSGKATVPDLAGKTASEAAQALYKAHLSIDSKDQVTDRPDEVGKVVYVPDAGKKVNNGSSVTVYIGKSPEKTATATVTQPPSSSAAPSSSSAPATSQSPSSSTQSPSPSTSPSSTSPSSTSDGSAMTPSPSQSSSK